MVITWGRASAFNLGRVAGTDIRVERNRDKDGKKWAFLISNDDSTYLYVDDHWYDTKEELDRGIEEWMKLKNY
ncbi:MAG TPA: hypothetical protein EYQ00_08570 [Dehalococcoidia bacterium]|nr:hypothetical protein [Dehalococcoidia bacterium]